MNHLIFPDCIIGLFMIFNAAVPETGQMCIIRAKGSDKHDPPDSASTVIQDQQPPTAVVPADLRPCQVHGTKGFSAFRMFTEKRAGIRQFFEYTLIQEKLALVRIDCNRCLFSGIFIINQKPEVPIIFLYNMYQSEMTAALPALETFEWQNLHSSYQIDTLPDGKPELKGDQYDDDPFKEVGVLDADFI